jgi:glycosyltransferase involved in cell wall biosynthesis
VKARGIDFSIILPVYNQAGHIEQAVIAYIDALEKTRYSFEIILVVNNSKDGSKKVCEQLAKKNQTIKSKYMEIGGWGRAVKAGLNVATGDFICYSNSARTSAQDLSLLLLYAAVNENRVIKANRKIRDNIVRRLGSLLYNLECRALFDIPYWDINGTPKVFPKEFVSLFELTRDDDLIDLEFVAFCKQNNYPLLEVPIYSQRRHGGKSTTNIKSAIKMYLNALLMWIAIRKDPK